MNALKKNNGFTLLEVLIALGIFASMMVTMNQIMDGVLQGKKETSSRAEIYHAVFNGLNRMYFDLNMAFVATSSFHGQNSYYLTGFKGSENSVNFSTLANFHFVKNKKDTDQIHVGYTLKKNENDSYDLMRRQTDHLVSDLEKGGKSFVLIPNVKEFELEFYNASKKKWEKQWDTDSISYAGTIPRTVKIKLVVYDRVLDEDDDDDEREEKVFELMVPVALYNSKISF